MLHPAALSMKAAMSSTDSVFFSFFTVIILSVSGVKIFGFRKYLTSIYHVKSKKANLKSLLFTLHIYLDGHYIITVSSR